jgi:hypothetical protein
MSMECSEKYLRDESDFRPSHYNHLQPAYLKNVHPVSACRLMPTNCQHQKRQKPQNRQRDYGGSGPGLRTGSA